ncbi:protein-tyrosine phosphatase 2 [Lasallia pustulata]|uniref:Protein-tyrosine phosphatase 2 n=1 Tax=Lasallia pustulata TaxID=136370 RepID=A0A1W5D092_9LECA|nr:protein-tyrosine phosphatase 2 [Lasallia pustulata]
MSSSTRLQPPTTSTSKRSRSRESQHSLNLSPILKQQESNHDASVPAFLRQSRAAVSTKFTALYVQDQERLLASQQNPDPSSEWFQEATPDVKARNRYPDVQAWANSRIHLKVPEGQCDYINASPISLRDPRTGANVRYIATQGPQQTGLSYFWQMIWHETKEVAVIVMLTRTAEAGRDKCFQYYPLDPENDSFQINTGNETNDTPTGSVRLLETDFHQASRATNTGTDNPRIVHCSAGVGRSGTFIALEHLLAELAAGSLADAKDDDDLIYNTVCELRKQRMMMVQSLTQYQFLYQVLRDEVKKAQNTARQNPARQNHEVKDLGKSTDGTEEPSPKMIKLTKGFKGAILGKTPWCRRRADHESDQNRSTIEPRTTVLLGLGIGVGVLLLAYGLKAFFRGVP